METADTNSRVSAWLFTMCVDGVEKKSMIVYTPSRKKVASYCDYLNSRGAEEESWEYKEMGYGLRNWY